MAKSKAARKKGQNSGLEEHKDEIRKIMKAQLALDRAKTTQQAEWRETHSKITARIKAIGGSRKALSEPYNAFKRTQNADTDEETIEAKENNVIDLAFQKLAYEAVSETLVPTGEIAWNKLFQEADDINSRRAEAAEAEEREEADEEDKGSRGGAGDGGGDEPDAQVH